MHTVQSTVSPHNVFFQKDTEGVLRRHVVHTHVCLLVHGMQTIYTMVCTFDTFEVFYCKHYYYNYNSRITIAIFFVH
jgi:hypothetical protein